MNYLAHALLSFNDEPVMVGNIMGDYVKGKIDNIELPERIKAGLKLHRLIDDFTDHHPAVAKSKILFKEDYGLYSGAVVDSLMDHFLANDPVFFANEKTLFDFSQSVYQGLSKYDRYFTERFSEVFVHMQAHNWLYGYRNLKGMEKALKGLAYRMQKPVEMDKAYSIFIGYYYQLNQSYFELMDDLVPYVKKHLKNENEHPAGDNK